MAEDVEIIDCECGHRMRVAVSDRRARVECPVCGKRHAVSVRESPLVANTVESPRSFGDADSLPGVSLGGGVRRRRRKKRANRALRWTAASLVVVFLFFILVYAINAVDFEKMRFTEVEIVSFAALLAGVLALVWRAIRI